MIDTVAVRRRGIVSEEATWNETLEKYEDDAVELGGLLYSGIGNISAKGWTPQGQLAAGQEQVVSTYTLGTPVGTAPFKEDDFVKVLASVRSEVLVGMVFIVKAPIVSSSEIQQRVLMEVWDGARPR